MYNVSLQYTENIALFEMSSNSQLWGSFFSQSPYNTPHPPGWGIVGLNIDRRIRQSEMLVSPYPRCLPLLFTQKNDQSEDYRHISLKNMPRCYTKTPTAQVIFWLMPHQLCWGDREMGTAISWHRMYVLTCAGGGFASPTEGPCGC